mmetsp:Transcript_23932/g.61112  ORF Transcript_23932/g.61112 Transcript_23932/m.61112 type:complete len:225 (+) Transcript_23932:628-1302(+)
MVMMVPSAARSAKQSTSLKQYDNTESPGWASPLSTTDSREHALPHRQPRPLSSCSSVDAMADTAVESMDAAGADEAATVAADGLDSSVQARLPTLAVAPAEWEMAEGVQITSARDTGFGSLESLQWAPKARCSVSSARSPMRPFADDAAGNVLDVNGARAALTSEAEARSIVSIAMMSSGQLPRSSSLRGSHVSCASEKPTHRTRYSGSLLAITWRLRRRVSIS